MSSTRSPRLKARILIERDGRILCVQHAKPGHEPFWCLPGGNIDPGEALADGALRELREETGVDGQLSGAVLVLDGPELTTGNGAVEVIMRGAIGTATPARRTDSGDPYLADLAWLPVDNLPDSFRPAALRKLLREAGSVAALPAIPVAAWG